MNKQEHEIHIFRKSLFILIGISISGMIIGVVANSEVVFFDGLFALLGVFTTMITIKASKYMNKKDDARFPFGKEQIEPLVVFFQYLFLNIFLLFILLEAIVSILNGGHQVEITIAFLYLFTLVIVIALVVRMMKKSATTLNSGLIDAELYQWQLEFKKGIFTLVSYVFSYLLISLSFNKLLPFIDPIVLILFVIFSFKETITKMIEAFFEMIGLSKIKKEKMKLLNEVIENYNKNYQIIKHLLRIKKVANLYVIEIDFLVDDNFTYQTIELQDKFREDFENDINNIFEKTWLTITFTRDAKWLT